MDLVPRARARTDQLRAAREPATHRSDPLIRSHTPSSSPAHSSLKIADRRSLRPDVSVEKAAATFSALASPELHHILTVGRGWSQERYRRWLERTAVLPLLAD